MDEFLDGSKELVQQSIKDGINEINNDISQLTEEVRDSANKLLDYTNKLRDDHKELLNELNSNNKSEEQVYQFTKKLITDANEFKELMNRVFDFQNKANTLLGQTVQMKFVYVDRKGEVKIYSIENSFDDLTPDKIASSRGGGFSGRYQIGKIKKHGGVFDYNSKAVRLDSTFKEVYTRFKISKQKQKLKSAAYILWKENSKNMDGAWISGAGPLAEAYFNFFINHYTFNNYIEKAVKDFMLNKKYGAILADNISGFLQGDIRGKDGREYGIKTQKAQSLGYSDIIKYAQEILKATDVKKYLKELQLELEQKGSQNMVRYLNNNLNEVSKELLDAIQNRIKS